MRISEDPSFSSNCCYDSSEDCILKCEERGKLSRQKETCSGKVTMMPYWWDNEESSSERCFTWIHDQFTEAVW